MVKKRVHELAKELNISSKELVKTIKKIGIPVQNHMSALEPHDEERILQYLTPPEEKKVVEARVKPSVIRRRVERLKVEREEVEAHPPLVEKEPAIEKPLISAKPFPEQVVEEKPEKIPKPPPEILEPLPPSEQKAPEPATEEVVPERKPEERGKEPLKPAPKPITGPTQIKERFAPKKKRVKHKEEPAQIIRKAEIPPVPTGEPEVSVETAEIKPKKKRILISDVEPSVEKIFRKKPKRETRVIAPAHKAFRKKERRVFREERVEQVISKKTEITVPKAIKRKIKIAELITVGELAKKMGVKASAVIKKLWELGLMATINQAIDIDTAQLASEEFGHEVEKVSFDEEELLAREEDDAANLHHRPPVITVMGHVDHGKTKLLDAIRQTNVAAGEAGGITQHIGAYLVNLPQGEIVFIDTPGHEAFTAMRARGSQVTDIVVLVVAANDGVQEQTIEAINHARDAKVPIIVAINKIDLPEANLELVRRQLSEKGLISEEWGGDTIFVEISAKQKINIDKLLEMILLQSEVLELKANPDKLARGVIIESRLDKGQGPIATVLIQEGTLTVGDPFVTGQIFGRVRAMQDDTGEKIKKAGPSHPVEVMGFPETPHAGELFVVVNEERKARMLAEYRQQKERQLELAQGSKVTLENLYDKIKQDEFKELKLILKADVHGSIEALREALSGLISKEIKLNIIHSAVGAIGESDVMLALASNAIIFGFNVAPDQKTQSLAQAEKVEIRTYSIIYDIIEDIKKAMEGLLTPLQKEKSVGRAEVLQVFSVSKVGTIAGSKVVEGKMIRGSLARVFRNGTAIYEGKIVSLKRFKDDVKEALTGFECGIQLENFNDVQSGDTIEAFIVEEVAQKL
ncbi:MAG: translation initiation factor IF-2 [Thermodesulfobacteriota bacterium]|nr:MAG: translation initiation factor IF-2 [Thermodesulfobacteriota bacterium]